MKPIITYFIAFVALALSLLSCSHDPIDDVKRKGINSPDVVLTSVTGVTNLSNSVYSVFRGGHFGLRNYALAGILADENNLVDIGSSGRGIDELRNVGAAGSHFNCWFFYAQINQCNLILKNLNTVPGISLTEKNRIAAEMTAMRAFLHLELAKVYSYFPNVIPTSGINAGFNSGIPYSSTVIEDPTAPTVPPRETVDVTYSKIIADLQASLALFRTIGEAPSLARGRFFLTRASTFGLLARAALYSQQWTLALQAADSCLRWSSGAAPNLGVADYTSGGFAAGWSNGASAQTESILEAQYAILAERLGAESLAGIYIEGTGGNGWGDYILSTEAFDAYSRFADGTLAYGAGVAATDVRATMSGGLRPNEAGVEPAAISAATGQTATTMLIRYNRPRGGIWRTINKWRTTKAGYGWHNVPLMRQSEIHLIRAEALARTGSDGAALTVINALRTRRNAPVYVTSPSGQAMIDVIMHERRLELIAEGHRWFDLKRQGLVVPKPAGFTPVQPGQREMLAPIPLVEQQLSGVPQNRGY